MGLQLVTSDTPPSESYLRGFSDCRARLGARDRWLIKALVVAALLAIGAGAFAVVDHDTDGAPPARDQVVTRTVALTPPPVKHRPTHSAQPVPSVRPVDPVAPRPARTVVVREVQATAPRQSTAPHPESAAGPSTVTVAPAPSSNAVVPSNCFLPSLLHSCVPVG